MFAYCYYKISIKKSKNLGFLGFKIYGLYFYERHVIDLEILKLQLFPVSPILIFIYYCKICKLLGQGIANYIVNPPST